MKKKILIVEDEKGMHDILRAFFLFLFKEKNMEGEIDIAASPNEAFGQIRETLGKDEVYDVLLTDKDLPRADAAFEIMRYAKKQMPQIKIILMSGNLTNQAIIEGTNCGAVDFLAKPFSLELFKKRLGGLI